MQKTDGVSGHTKYCGPNSLKGKLGSGEGGHKTGAFSLISMLVLKNIMK